MRPGPARAAAAEARVRRRRWLGPIILGLLASPYPASALAQRPTARLRYELNAPATATYSAIGFEAYAPGLNGFVIEADPAIVYNWGAWDFGILLGGKLGYERAPLVAKAGLEGMLTREAKLSSGQGMGGVYDFLRSSLRLGYLHAPTRDFGFSVYYEGFLGQYTRRAIGKGSREAPWRNTRSYYGNGAGFEFLVFGAGLSFLYGMASGSSNELNPFFRTELAYAFR